MAKARNVTTKPVSPFTREGAKFLHPKIAEAVRAALAPYGVSVARTHYTFGAKAQIVMAFEGVAADGKTQTSIERNAFEKLYADFGMKKTDLDKEFSWGGKTYTVAGLNHKKRGGRRGEPKAIKLLCAEDGRVYWGTATMVRAAIDSHEAESTKKRGTKKDDEVVKTKTVRKTRIRHNADNTDTPAVRRKLKGKKAKAGKAGRRISTF